MSWLKKLLPTRVKTASEKRGVPEGIWSKCDACKAILYSAELLRNNQVCPKCRFHNRITARNRLKMLFDDEHFIELSQEITSRDPLKFKDSKKYKDRLSTAQKNTSEKEALLVGKGTIKSQPVIIACFNFAFMGGSMGSAVGQAFVQGVECAIRERHAFVCVTASGGARMQEGLISLMQMAKTSAALAKLTKAGLPFISILTDPTMGGVSASLAMLGDIIIAEPKALIGFAGPRVIEQTVRQKLPEGFQRSEFLLEHGHIDQVVDRRDLKDRVAFFIEQLTYNQSK